MTDSPLGGDSLFGAAPKAASSLFGGGGGGGGCTPSPGFSVPTTASSVAPFFGGGFGTTTPFAVAPQPSTTVLFGAAAPSADLLENAPASFSTIKSTFKGTDSIGTWHAAVHSENIILNSITDMAWGSSANWQNDSFMLSDEELGSSVILKKDSFELSDRQLSYSANRMNHTLKLSGRAWGYSTDWNKDSLKICGRESGCSTDWKYDSFELSVRAWGISEGSSIANDHVQFVPSSTTAEMVNTEGKGDTKRSAMEYSNACFYALLSRDWGSSDESLKKDLSANITSTGNSTAGSTDEVQGVQPLDDNRSSFGLPHMMKAKATAANDQEIGKWEIHTKGIGSKLLAKMGYQGSGGLGSKRRWTTDAAGATERPGVSQPIEVVVRPKYLGLGYGKFQRTSSLKVNRQLEAEILGNHYKLRDNNESRTKSEPYIELHSWIRSRENR